MKTQTPNAAAEIIDVACPNCGAAHRYRMVGGDEILVGVQNSTLRSRTSRPPRYQVGPAQRQPKRFRIVARCPETGEAFVVELDRNVKLRQLSVATAADDN